jgi:hypothetical protein
MRTLLVLAIVSLVIPLASAQTCSNTDPNAKQIDTSLGTYYLVVDNCPSVENGCLFSIWIYEETNHIPGLQRDDEVNPTDPADPNACPPDGARF